MSLLKKLLVVNDSPRNHSRPFHTFGFEYTDDPEILQRTPEQVAMVVFTGGADVSPEIYDRAKHPATFSNFARDVEEMNVFDTAQAHGVPMVGICRGAQLLCVMAGGKLLQDVTNHGMCTHPVTARFPEGYIQELMVKGDHHQMQYPWDLPTGDFEVLAWSPKPYSMHYAFDAESVIDIDAASAQLKTEPDVVWYPKIKALGMQFHPEWMPESAPAVDYVQQLVEHYIIPYTERDADEANRA